jgi:hypothetical protein
MKPTEGMTLSQLKKAVDNAIECAGDYGRNPDEIPVTLQIDRADGDPVWSDFGVELHYDDDLQASGCVLSAFLEAETPTNQPA